MLRNRRLCTPSGRVFTCRVERKYVPGFQGESLLYLLLPEDGSPRFTILVAVPGVLMARLGPEFDRLAEAGLPFVEAELEAGASSDLRVELDPRGGVHRSPAQGLRKYPMPGADGGEVGSWG